MTDNRKYRPSNGTEGDLFMSRFCHTCVHMRDDGRPPCDILGRTFYLGTDDTDYPAEWTYDAQGEPTCTAFSVDDGSSEPEPTRCPVTRDMFA